LYLFSNVLGYKLLSGFIENAEHCQKFIKKIDDDVFLAVDGLDPIEDLTLDWIFSKLMRLGGVEGEAIEFVRIIIKFIYLFTVLLRILVFVHELSRDCWSHSIWGQC
jgi:hypothetical protein